MEHRTIVERMPEYVVEIRIGTMWAPAFPFKMDYKGSVAGAEDLAQKYNAKTRVVEQKVVYET